MQQDSFSQDLALKISLYIYTHTQNKLEFSLFGGRGDTQRTPTTPHRSLGDVVVLLICSWTWWQTREWCGQHIGWPSLLLQFQELNAQSLTRERTCVITISVANKFLLEKSDIYFFFLLLQRRAHSLARKLYVYVNNWALTYMPREQPYSLLC